MKKIPKGAEASNILVGEVNFLEKSFSAFIRLQEAAILGDLTEVPVPTRFLFIMLGPCVSKPSIKYKNRTKIKLFKRATSKLITRLVEQWLPSCLMRCSMT